MLVVATTCLGLPIALTRSVSMHKAAERFGSLRGTADKGIKYSVISGVCVALLFFLLGQSILTGISSYFANQFIIQILSINIFSQILSNNLSAIVMGLRKFSAVASITLFSILVKTIFGLIYTSISGKSLDAIFWWCMGDLTSASLFAIIVAYFIKNMPKNSVSFRELLKISTPLLVSYYINNVYIHLERLAVLIIAGLDAVAIYAIASTLCTAFTTVYSSISSGLFPTFSQQYERGESSAVFRLSFRVSKLVPLIYFPLVSIGLVGAPYFVNFIYSNLYITAYPIFLILIMGTMVASLSTSLATSALAIGDSKLVMVADSIGFSAFLSFLLLSSLSNVPLLIIALARGIMIIVTIMILYLRLSLRGRNILDTASIGRLSLIFIISSVIGLMTIFIISDIVGLFVSVLLITLSQILLIRLNQLLSKKDVSLFTNLLPSLIQNKVQYVAIKLLIGDSE